MVEAFDKMERSPLSTGSCDAPSWYDDIPSLGGSCSKLTLMYNRWTYSYMNIILKKGSEQHKAKRKIKRHDIVRGEGVTENYLEPKQSQDKMLTQLDLYRVPVRMLSSHLSREFWSTYNAEKGNFLLTLWRLAAPTFVPAGLCQFVTVVAQVSIPLLVWKILLILEANPYQSVVKQGLPYAILLFGATVVNGLFDHRHHHLSFQSGIVVRSAVINAIYEHSLRLSPDGKMGLTTGQVTNLAATDTQKLFEVMQEGHLIWSCPLAIFLVSILLLLIIGPAALAGILTLVILVPSVKLVVSAMISARSKRVKIADDRVEILSAMLQGMKVTKLNNYEIKFERRVANARSLEMKYVRKEQLIWGLTLVMMVTTPVVATATTFATYVLVSDQNVLTASLTFTTMMLFSALRFPINYGGKLIGKAALGYQAAHRIARFFERGTRNSRDKEFGDERSKVRSGAIVGEGDCNGIDNEKCFDKKSVLVVEDGTFVVGDIGAISAAEEMANGSSPSFRVSNINLAVAPGETVAVVGPVGSGKSSLVNGIIGEINPVSGIASVKNGRIACASQTPFILNATLRENILFGLEFNEARYERVLDACCLRPDLKQLGPSGDMTQIGERGVTLSGGQKQRVSIARAIYSNPNLAVFDDPLSALDAGTSRVVFDNLFSKTSKYDLLSSSAVILVTHGIHFLHRVDRILVLNEGMELFLGTWEELSKFEPRDHQASLIIDSIRASLKEGYSPSAGNRDARENDDEDEKAIHASFNWDNKNDGEGSISQEERKQDQIMTVEDREHGLSSLRTWSLWFKYAGGVVFLLVQIAFMAVDRLSYVAIELWLAFWTDATEGPVYLFGKEFPSQAEGRTAQFVYLKVYAVLFLIMVFFCTLRSEWAVSGGARCSERLFAGMTARVLYAPMSYFETTPLGRILNRFTYDVEVLDTTLTQAMTILLVACSWFVAAVCIMISIIPWIVAVLVPVMVVYYMVFTHYRKSAADLQRLDAVSRSPVQALLAEGLDGAATIRVFDVNDFFIDKFRSSLDTNSSAMLNFISAHRWLAVRIEMLGAIITLAAALFVTVFNDTLKIDPGIVGLLIIWASNFTITLGFLVTSVSESEAAIVSIERVHRMSQLPQEKSMTTADEYKPEESWPTNGLLQFDNVKMRYRNGLNLALDGLSFRLEHGKHCGVVGRTGAGKSTLTTALFRLVEIEAGHITVDGIDLASLGLSDVRGRSQGISIIPQDPVLFPGTLRECLDPFHLSSDENILEAMRAVMISSAERGTEALDEIVEEDGSNFSVGERQLLCLARALLAKPKILVMDEATASIDGKTDACIQKMLRNRFGETTLLTIAHRLNTIMDYDMILVMDKGKAVEFGSPKELLEIEGGLFAELVDATGEENSAALKEIAEKSATRS